MDIPPFDAKRIVKPRVPATRFYPVIALHGNQACHETGDTCSRTSLYSQLITMGSHIVACQSSANTLADLDDIYSGAPGWQWKCSSREREFPADYGESTITQLDTVVHFFGWQDKQRKNHRYHLVLDPVTFYGRSLHEIDDSDRTPIHKLLAWAIQIRDWCNDNQIAIRPSNGGTAAQFLRDGRFYPSPRRKVPRESNRVARENLPGNHYDCRVSYSARERTGIYIDQRRAHHYHARTIRLPDANSLYAFGDFQRRERAILSWNELGTDFCGLCYGILDDNAPRFYFTTDMPYLRDAGHTFGAVIAAWGSTKADTGLAKYAKWAESELDKYEDAPWLKPILLATYGVLAAKPRVIQFTFKDASSGRECLLPAGNRQLLGLLVGGTSGRKIEPSISNVLHRALIESATRCESLGLADWLKWRGYRILSIYADAVIVEQDDDLPNVSDIVLPEPWRVKQTLHHLRFLNSQSFVSGEMTKLPGVLRRDEALAASMGTVGKAPKQPKWDALTGMRTQ